MMVEAVLLGCHLVITLGAVFAIAVRNEHRLTKIETDLTWLKNQRNECCEKENTNVEGSGMD